MLIILILFFFISMGAASAANDNSINETVISTTDGGSLSVPMSESADDSSLAVNNDDEILSATHDFSGTTVDELKTLLEGGTVQDGDTVYLGNQDISSSWDQWSGNVINVNVPNVIISGGSSSNPNGLSTINANQAKVFNFIASGITLTNVKIINSQGGSGPGSAVNIDAPDCTISNCEFENCQVTEGGAIHGTSSATNTVIDNCNFTNNQARWGGHGGAIYTEGSATITDCNFNGNHAENGNGAVYIAGSATVSNSNFTGNYANGNGGALTLGGDNSVVENCNFINNNANGYTQGGALELLGYDSQVINSTFKQNSATSGGAVYIDKSGAKIEDCEFEDNSATFGGAINIYHDDTTITNCNFTNNDAENYGGAIYVADDCHNADMTDCNFKDNTAGTGTAIYVDDTGDAKVTDCTFGVKPDLDVENQYPSLTATLTADYSNVVVGNVEGASTGEGSVPLANKNITLEIYDSNNQLVDNVTDLTDENGQITYDYGNLPHGSYTYKAYTKEEDSLIQNEGRINMAEVEGNGFSSIQGAIDNANPGDVIFLKGITYENDFNHQMVIDKPITIIGTDGTVLDAEGESRIFNVNNGISGVNLANIEFINGYTNGVENDNGGAIRFGNGCNNIRITNSSFRDNRALYGMDQEGDATKGNGAGIFFGEECHDVEIANCNFENGSSYNGGGIFIDDNGHDFIIDNCNFTENDVNNRTTGGYDWGDADGHGGGIYISPNANRGIISNSNFINNNATVSGGAIDNYKGNDWAVFNSTFIGNNVTIQNERPDDIDHGAGAIWCCNSIMNITNCTFENNEAAYGGALRGAFNVYDSQFENNTATNGNGGAMDVAVDSVIAMTLNLEFANSTFYNNDAKGNRSDERAQGGAIHIFDIYSVNMTDCICINNTADRGGAVDFYQLDYTNVENCTFDNNDAIHEGGGLAIFCDHSIFKDTEVSNNNAGTDGGAIWNIGHNSLFDNVTSIDNTATRGGSAYVEGDNTTVQNSTFDGNSAENGGGFYVVGDDCNLINVEVSNNEATDYGGAIYISGNNATLDNVTSKENTASNGGSTYISGNDAVVKNSIFDNNEAYEAGAGIYIEGDDSKVNNNSFSYNEAFFGAGVFVSGENANFTTNNISHNNGFIGAGISVEGDHALFVDNNITYNDASYGAGGVFVQGSNANFTHNNISSNHAEENGGGIWCAGENLYLDEIYAFNNTAENGGFGVISQANNLIVKNSSFISNHADGDIGRNRGEGGAFHIYDSYNADIEGNFYNNTATNGSAIYVQDSTLKVHDSNFFDNQARSWQLNITPKPNTQFDQSESIEISVSHQGGDNIANAIHNRDGESDVQVKNITYPFYTVDGQVINKTTPNRYVTPVGSPDAEDIYLYDFENNQVITLVLYSGKGNFTYNGTTGEYDYNGNGKEINRFTYIVHPLYEIENQGNEIIVTQCGKEKTYTYDENTGKYIFNDSGKVSTCTYENVGDGVYQYHFNESGKETTVVYNESSNKYTFHLTNGRVTEFYYNETTGEYIFNDAGKIRKYYSINKTDIYGTIDLPLSKIIGTLDVGNYTVLALYKESTYYTEIYNRTNFEVISPLKKLTVNQTVILGDNVDFTIIVNNSLKNITVNNVTYENGTTLHNVTITEIFNTAELEYINHTNSNKWVLNSTSTFNQTVNNKTVNYTAMVFKYQGNLSFGESSSFNITFKTLMTGTLINTVNLTTNETGNKTFTAKNKTFVYRLLEKLTVNETVNLGENVDFIVVVNNPENSTFGNKTNGTNGTTLHNITIYEIFKTSELQYVNHTNKDKWVINSTSTFNQTVGGKTVNYTCMVLKYQGNLSANKSINFTITFKTLTTGILNNTVNLTTNETGNRTLNATNKTVVYKLLDKLTVNETVNIGENVDFIVVVNNPINSTFGNNTNGTTLHNITIYEIFKTSELQYVNHTNKDKWVINSTSTFNQTVGGKAVNYTCMVFKYQGNLSANKSANFTITFKTLVNGTLINTVNLTTNETGNKTYTADNKTKVLNLTVSKLSLNKTVYLGNESQFVVVVDNPDDIVLHNVTIYEIFKTSELQYVNHTNKDKWVINSTSTFNQTVGGKAVNYTCMVFKYQGNLSAKTSVNFTIAFKTLVNGTLINTVNLTTNETGNNNYTANNNTTVLNPNMTVEKVSLNGTDFVVVNDTVAFNITVFNTGDCDLHNVNVTDVFDASEFTFVGYSEDKGWTRVGTSYVFTYGTLAKGANSTFTVWFRALTNGTLPNNVTARSNETNDTNDTANVTVNKLISINVTKKWNDANDQDGIRPANITVELRNDTGVVDSAVLSADNNWTAVFTDLPVNCNGSAINYTFYEADVDGYDSEVTNSTLYNWTIINTHVPEVTEVNVTKVWIDFNDKDGVRPDNVTVILYANGKDIKNATLNKSNDWKVTFDNLDKYENGVLIKYSVEELDVTGYNTTIYNNTYEFTIVNFHICPNMTVEKIALNKTVFVGNNTEFVIVVKNTGNCNLTDVKVTEIYDKDQLDLIGYVDASGRWSQSGDVFVFDGNLTVGESTNFTVIFETLVNGTLVNQVNASSNETDNKTGNNTTTVFKPNMTVQKISLNKTVLVGNNTEFVIVVTNTGDCNLTNVKVTEIFNDNELEYIKHSNEESWTKSGNVFDYDGVLAPGESANFTITFKTLVNGTLINKVNASSNETDNKTGNNTTDVKPVCDLEISKLVNTSDVFVGDMVEWTIIVKNNGPNAAENVIVRDDLPDNIEFTVPEGCEVEGNTLIWNIGKLGLNESKSLVLVTKLLAEGEFNNFVSVNTTTNESDYDNNDANNTTVANPICDLIINKTVNASSIDVGDNVEWTINVINVGPSTALDVKVIDTLPDGVIILSANPNAGSFNKETRIWEIGNLSANKPVSLILVTRVEIEGNVTNVVMVNTSTYEPNKTNNEANNTTVANPICDLEITKLVNASKVYENDFVEWTIVVSNKGPSVAYDVKVNDVLPDGLELISATSSVGSYSNGIWTIGTMDKDATQSLVLITQAVQLGNITNIASVNGTTPENDTTNNVANNTTEVNPVCDLEITKLVNASSVNITDFVEWTVIVVNHGPSTAKDVKVTESLPDGLKLISADPSVGSYSNGIWTIGDLEKDASVSLVLITQVVKEGNLTNIVIVNSTTPDNNESNNKANNTTEVNPVCDLDVIKLVSSKKAYVGEELTWTIIARNHGPSAGLDVKVLENIPNSLKFIRATASQGTYDAKTQVWTIGKLENGSSVTLQLVTKVLSVGNITNPVEVTTTTPENNTTNNKANNTTEGIAIVDLAVFKGADKEVYHIGDSMYWFIVVVNYGPCDAHEVVAHDVLPDGVKFIGWESSKGSYDVSTGIWYIGDLAKDEEAVLYIDCEVLIEGIITNYVNVTCNETDSDLSNNYDNCTVEVINETEPPVTPEEPPAKTPVTMKNTGNPLAYLVIALVIIFGSFLTQNRKE